MTGAHAALLVAVAAGVTMVGAYLGYGVRCARRLHAAFRAADRGYARPSQAHHVAVVRRWQQRKHLPTWALYTFSVLGWPIPLAYARWFT